MTVPPRSSPPTGLRRLLFRLPLHLYRAHLGWLLGHRFVLINHLGRQSGRPREVVVEIVSRLDDTGSIVVASGFGPGADWYQNLRAHPATTIRLGTRSIPVHAAPMTAAEGGEIMLAYTRRHPRTARKLAGLMGFSVDGSENQYRALGQEIPFLRLDPQW